MADIGLEIELFKIFDCRMDFSDRIAPDLPVDEGYNNHIL